MLSYSCKGIPNFEPGVLVQNHLFFFLRVNSHLVFKMTASPVWLSYTVDINITSVYSNRRRTDLQNQNNHLISLKATISNGMQEGDDPTLLRWWRRPSPSWYSADPGFVKAVASRDGCFVVQDRKCYLPCTHSWDEACFKIQLTRSDS